ncbi:MAG: nucleotide exchange factor GrpE [Bacteroidota bacterium]
MINKLRNMVKKSDEKEAAENDGADVKKAKKLSKKELEQQLQEKETELIEMKDKYLRIFAEFDNYKKRTVKERIELMSSAAQDLMRSLLPVLDDFDRAKIIADDDATDEVMTEGVALVYNKLNTILSQKGLKAMETKDEVFDPELHEAISELPVPDEEAKGKIFDTVEKGYYLNDKIIRHAKVVVGK